MAASLLLDDPFTVATEYWHRLDDGRIQCDVCPRACKLHEGQRGVCFVRGRVSDQVVLASYGRSSGLCADPIEKKPLHHFLPGTGVLSFGTAGCNLSCRFCQNWDISKSKVTATLAVTASPDQIARAAAELDCSGVAFTYNDPVVFLEYAIDTARACHELGLHTVAVTAGYVSPKPRADFFAHMDAANIDLKAFSDDFYRHVVMGSLAAVLETIEYVHTETDAWLELTTLLIPGHNDSDEEVGKLVAWVADRLGTEVPLHFSAFHPAFRMLDVPPTPPATLHRARRIARDHGLHYVYTGNVPDRAGTTTRCPGCAAPLIERSGYLITGFRLDASGRCPECGSGIAGRFGETAGEWGSGRPAPAPDGSSQ